MYRKRCASLFKKACEIHTKTGADVMLLVRAPRDVENQDDTKKLFAYASTNSDWMRAWYDMTCDTLRERTQVQSMRTIDYNTLFSKKTGQWSRLRGLESSYTSSGNVEVLDALYEVEGHAPLFIVDDEVLHEMHPTPVDTDLAVLERPYKVPVRQQDITNGSSSRLPFTHRLDSQVSGTETQNQRVDKPWAYEATEHERARQILYAHALRNTMIKDESILDPLTTATHLAAAGSVPSVYVGYTCTE